VSKWRVVKRDGCWHVLDTRGLIRYSAGDWLMAVTFALVAAEPFDQARVNRVNAQVVMWVLQQYWEGDEKQ